MGSRLFASLLPNVGSVPQSYVAVRHRVHRSRKQSDHLQSYADRHDLTLHLSYFQGWKIGSHTVSGKIRQSWHHLHTQIFKIDLIGLIIKYKEYWATAFVYFDRKWSKFNCYFHLNSNARYYEYAIKRSLSLNGVPSEETPPKTVTNTVKCFKLTKSLEFCIWAPSPRKYGYYLRLSQDMWVNRQVRDHSR